MQVSLKKCSGVVGFLGCSINMFVPVEVILQSDSEIFC